MVIDPILLAICTLVCFEVLRLRLCVPSSPRLTIAQIEYQRIQTWAKTLPEHIAAKGYRLESKPVIHGNRAACLYQRPCGNWVAEAVVLDILHRRTLSHLCSEGPTAESVDAAHQLHKVWVYQALR
jgi:hypothetical protein